MFEGGRITSGVTIEGSVTANAIRTPATIGGSPSTTANASSSINSDGFAKFVSASIGGFTIETERIQAQFVPASSSISQSILNTVVSASGVLGNNVGELTMGVSSFNTNAGNSTFWANDLSTSGSNSFSINVEGIPPMFAGSVSRTTITSTNGDATEITVEQELNPSPSGRAWSIVTNAGDIKTVISQSIQYETINFPQQDGLVLSDAGQITASAALFSGVVKAQNFSEKIVTINDANSGSFLQYVSGDTITGKKDIVFNGGLGGERMMNCVIDVSAGFTISDILIDSGSDTFNDVTIIVQTIGMSFDNSTVSALPADVYTPRVEAGE